VVSPAPDKKNLQMKISLRLIAGVLAALAILATVLWCIDYITLQGEWTVYTVECRQGTWAGDQCTGKLAAGDRYRFRALKAHKEVLFWIVGSTDPSGRLAPCEIENRANWVCKAGADGPKSITLALSKGSPVIDPAANTRQVHAVSKTRWMYLKYTGSDEK
jgi:hypothetical protein